MKYTIKFVVNTARKNKPIIARLKIGYEDSRCKYFATFDEAHAWVDSILAKYKLEAL